MAMLWGSTFFSLKDVITRVPVVDLLFVRFAIASLVLVLAAPRQLRMSRVTAVRGLLLGLLFGVAQIVQTLGLAHTQASVSGFITGLYVVATPLLGAALFRLRMPLLTWLAVGLATVGLGVLSLQPSAGGLTIGVGELLTFASAVLYALHILALGRWSTGATSLSLTIVQSVIVTLVCGAAAVPGGITLPTRGGDWVWLLYLAVLCGAVPLFLQIWAQAFVEPTRAAVIMSTEPVWAAFFAVTLGGESVTWRLAVGGLAILVAMYAVIRTPVSRSDVAADRLSAV